MTSVFAGIEEMISDAIDDVYASDVVFVFMRPGGSYSDETIDPSHEAITVKGIVDFAPLAVMPQDLSQYDGMQPFLAGDKIHVSFDVAEFADSRQPEAGDIINATLEGEALALRVSRAEPDRLGRILCICTPGA